jgi:hypothetical protein
MYPYLGLIFALTSFVAEGNMNRVNTPHPDWQPGDKQLGPYAGCKSPAYALSASGAGTLANKQKKFTLCVFLWITLNIAANDHSRIASFEHEPELYAMKTSDDW